MSSWDDELVAELAATGAIDSVDLKGQYEGTVVDQPADPALYRRVIEALPDAWIEDPAVTDDTRPILEPHAARITWDAPIHSVAGHRERPVAAAHDQHQAVALRQRPPALRRLRLLRREGHRAVRRRPVGARPRTRADPVPRVAVPPRHGERRRPRRLQRARAAAGLARHPARAPGRRRPAFAGASIAACLACSRSARPCSASPLSRCWAGLPGRGTTAAFPGSYNAMELATPDYGGGPHAQHLAAAQSLEQLHGPQAGEPDFATTLTAQKATVRLSSGKEIRAWTFNGSVPGPELRVRQGDLVAVTLVNRDLDEGVSIHWHGVDVPNREDGVSGVTQDALRPGESYTYRFRAEQVGTFWYHTHQNAAKGVRLGLYGALVIAPQRSTARASTWSRPSTRSPARLRSARTTALDQREVAPGTPVRLRLLNTDSSAQKLVLEGTPFRVAAIDGTEITDPACGGGRGDRGRRGWALRPRLHDAGRAGSARCSGIEDRASPRAWNRDRRSRPCGPARRSIRPATGRPRCRSTSPASSIAASTSTSIGSSASSTAARAATGR